jgi:predicted nuclease of predicted toxin-antitoxin system
VKLLLDENLSPSLVQTLSELFPGSQHVNGVGLQGRSDSEIWDYAGKNGFAILSKDNDFRQRSFLNGHPPKVIWASVGNAGTRVIALLMRRSTSQIKVFFANLDESLLVLELDNLDGD